MRRLSRCLWRSCRLGMPALSASIHGIRCFASNDHDDDLTLAIHELSSTFPDKAGTSQTTKKSRFSARPLAPGDTNSPSTGLICRSRKTCERPEEEADQVISQAAESRRKIHLTAQKIIEKRCGPTFLSESMTEILSLWSTMNDEALSAYVQHSPKLLCSIAVVLLYNNSRCVMFGKTRSISILSVITMCLQALERAMIQLAKQPNTFHLLSHLIFSMITTLDRYHCIRLRVITSVLPEEERSLQKKILQHTNRLWMTILRLLTPALLTTALEDGGSLLEWFLSHIHDTVIQHGRSCVIPFPREVALADGPSTLVSPENNRVKLLSLFDEEYFSAVLLIRSVFDFFLEAGNAELLNCHIVLVLTQCLRNRDVAGYGEECLFEKCKLLSRVMKEMQLEINFDLFSEIFHLQISACRAHFHHLEQNAEGNGETPQPVLSSESSDILQLFHTSLGAVHPGTQKSGFIPLVHQSEIRRVLQLCKTIAKCEDLVCLRCPTFLSHARRFLYNFSCFFREAELSYGMHPHDKMLIRYLYSRYGICDGCVLSALCDTAEVRKIEYEFNIELRCFE